MQSRPTARRERLEITIHLPFISSPLRLGCLPSHTSHIKSTHTTCRLTYPTRAIPYNPPRPPFSRSDATPRHIITALPSCATSFPKSLATFSPPRPQQPSFLLDNHQAEIFGLALSSKALQGPWMRIYNREEDGLSFNRWVREE